MARVSRKADVRDEHLQTSTDTIKIFMTGIYVRLSVEDNGKDDRDSIENQITLLDSFVASKPYLCKEKLYVDNGFTGTDFQRPKFMQMMDDVRSGKIDCIVVKDLSRLGRNFLEAGEYLEKIFPFLGVRFIAVNDNYDTANLSSNTELNASLKNLVNDIYAKDISRKVGSTMKTKIQRGDYIGNYAPYGYLKDPDDKNHLIPDPEVSATVTEIFEMRASGMSYDRIVRALNERDIPSPGRLRFERGIITNNNKKGKSLGWNRHVLKDILDNVAYIGSLAQGRSGSCLHEGIPFHWVDKDDWIIVEGTHEAIVNDETWERVQAVNESRRSEYKANFGKYEHLPKAVSPYGKILVCADCGRVIKLTRSIAHGGKAAYFTYKCPTYIEQGEAVCVCRNIKAEELDTAILATIKAQMDLFMDMRYVLDSLVKRKQKKAQSSDSALRTKELQQLIKRKNSLCTSLYTDLKEGTLSKEEYLYAKNKYQSEILQLTQELKELQSSMIESAADHSDEAKWRQLVDRYYHADHITAEMVQAMIKKIELHADKSISVEFRYVDEFNEIADECTRLRKEIA